ncbi:MAG: cupredoxin domain-containing protein [Gemmatimonadota bacterium]
MATDVILVNVAALATIAWIVWYFWLSESSEAIAVVSDEGVQEVYVRVRGGYDPDMIVVSPGRPTRLHFNRQETAACSEMVLFPDLDISRRLPTDETVTIEIDPLQPGEYEFACQMGMLRGKLVVSEELSQGHGAPDGAD